MASLNLPVVKLQRAALKVDTEQQSFSGWTELHIAAPAANGGTGPATVALHCYGLEVQAVTVNDMPASYDVLPSVREQLPEGVTAASYDSPQRQLAAVSDAAFYLYERQLQQERQPELSIQVPAAAQQQQAGTGPAGSGSKDELVIRVKYSGGGAGSSGTGMQFWGRYGCTDNQVRRASAWLPCVDVPSAATSFELDITCRADEMVVGPGQLQHQSWEGSSKEWRTFHYSVPVNCAACHLGFAVGTFRLLADTPARRRKKGKQASQQQQQQQQQQQAADDRQLTHFAPLEVPPDLEVAAVLAVPPSTSVEDSDADKAAAAAAYGLPRSSHFFGLAFSLFEEVLGTRCPLPAMQQVFLPPELLLSSSQALAGLQMLGTPQLIQPRAIEQSIAARCAIARCLARQWFGVLLRAATPLDEWLIEGLSGWLEEQAILRFMGRNELAYRRWRQRQAIFLADNGEAPPLAARGLSVSSPWGPLYGTERLDPSGLWSAKATAVVAMLEKRAGEELFRKHVGDVVAAGMAALQAEQAGTAAAAGPGTPGSKAGGPAAATGTPGGDGVPASSPQQQQQQQQQREKEKEGVAAGTRLLDALTFMNELGRAGSFRKEMAPFAARWVYGRGVPHISAAFIYHSRMSVLELALSQTGPESAKRAADVAARAAAAEGSNAGIIKAVVREGEPPTNTDHPVHLGAEAFVLAELKVTPIVEKKVPGRRAKKPKKEEDEAAAGLPAVATPEEPVLWVRLDPAGELLCDIRLMQPERMQALQLVHSRDVVAQAEAVQRLGELRLHSSQAMLTTPGVAALRRTLHDRSVFYRVRCDAALALAGLRDEEGQPAGLPLLLDFYRSQYFVPGSEVPRSIAIADPSEYYVAQAVATAVSLCREADGSTPIDALLFLSTCLTDYASVPGAPFSDYGLVAALCSCLGNVQFEGFGDSLLTLLEKFLERDSVLVSPGNAIGCACLASMAALCANGTCSEEEQQRVATTVRRVRLSPGLPVAVRHAALAAALALAAAQRGPAAALHLALAAAEARDGGAQSAAALQLPAASTPAFLLEQAAQLVTAATQEAAAAAAAAAAFSGEEQLEGGGATAAQPGGAAPLPLPLPLLQRLAGLLSARGDCRSRHLAFVLLQLLAVQPPTLYRPPPGEADDDAAAFFTATAAAGQAVSVGATHRSGQPNASANPAPGPKMIRLNLGGGGGGGARSVAGSGGATLSGEGPAASDARALSYGAVDQQGVPPGAQGQLFSPLAADAAAAYAPFGAADGGEEASSRQPQHQQSAAPALALGLAPQQAQVHAPVAAAAPAVPISKFRFKMPAQQQQQQQQQQAPPVQQQPQQQPFAPAPQAWQQPAQQQPFVPVLPPEYDADVPSVGYAGLPWQPSPAAWDPALAVQGALPAMPQPFVEPPAAAPPAKKKLVLKLKLKQ